MEQNTDERKIEEILAPNGTKGFLNRFIFGIIYGLAVIIPGISGAAISIIFKLYDNLLYSVSNLFKKFKICFIYLLPILLGFCIGFIVGFFAIQKLLEVLPFSLILLFAGLMIGSFPIVLKEIKGNKRNIKNTSLFLAGLLIPSLILIFTVILNFSTLQNDAQGIIDNVDDATRYFGDFPFWMLLAAIPIGMVMGVTQVVPGLSASAFLMMIGWFSPIMDSIHFDYIKNNPKIILLLLILVIGFVAGFFLTSKLIDFAINKNRITTYQVIVGLSLGSILTMFLNPDIFTIYLSWYYNGIVGTRGVVDIALAAPLLIGGVILAYVLVRFEMKKTAEN